MERPRGFARLVRYDISKGTNQSAPHALSLGSVGDSIFDEEQRNGGMQRDGKIYWTSFNPGSLDNQEPEWLGSKRFRAQVSGGELPTYLCKLCKADRYLPIP